MIQVHALGEENVLDDPLPPRRGLRVLVAEDEALIAMAIEQELLDRGYEVTLASDGQEALDLWAAHGPFDVLVSDMQMPRLAGNDLVRRLRAEHPGLPVVVVSANYGPKNADALLALGRPLSILTKPIHFDRLAGEVGRLAIAGQG
jgi:CheY-like chemotaxis protein